MLTVFIYSYIHSSQAVSLETHGHWVSSCPDQVIIQHQNDRIKSFPSITWVPRFLRVDCIKLQLLDQVNHSAFRLPSSVLGRIVDPGYNYCKDTEYLGRYVAWSTTIRDADGWALRWASCRYHNTTITASESVSEWPYRDERIIYLRQLTMEPAITKKSWLANLLRIETS